MGFARELLPCGDSLNTGIVKKLLERSGLEHRIIVVDDIFRCSVIWSHITELPELIWGLSDRYMNDSSCPMMNHYQDIQDSKRKSRYREEGNSPHFLSMILVENIPEGVGGRWVSYVK